MNLLEQHWPVLIVTVPLAAAPIVTLLRRRDFAWATTVAASLCTFGLALGLAGRVAGPTLRYAVGSWPAPYGIELRVDEFAALILIIVTATSSVALLTSRRSVPLERAELFYGAWLLALAGLLGMVVAGDAFNIFVFMEISSLATYVLVAGGAERRALTAVFTYLIMGTIGATFYLIGVGFLYMMTGTLNLADIAARIGAVADSRPVLAAGGFITVGLAIKAAVFPLHGWLPGAYTYAPHAATAFIAACSTKVALYVLFTFQFGVFPAGHAGAQFATFALPLAMVGMVVASAIAVYERDLKRMLAYSSVAQIGYIVLGAGLGSAQALTGALAHMFNHALAKGTLFIALAALARPATRLTIDAAAGAARRAPITMAAFVIAGLSLIGLPGTAGFVGKWQLIVAAADIGPLGLAAMVPLLASSLLAVVYVWGVVEAAYLEPGPPAVAKEAPSLALAALAVSAGANLYFGFQPQVPLRLAQDAAAALLGLPAGK